MVALRENKIGIASGEQESSKDISLPEQHMSVFHRNGTGTMVEETVTPRSFYESGVYKEIAKGMEGLRAELKSILKRKKKLSRRTKHGGRAFSQTELTQRREALEELGKKENEVREAMNPKERIATTLRYYLEASNPLNPLHLRVSPVVHAIDIIKGTPMEEGDQNWWAFIRKEAPEIWTLHQKGRERDYGIIHTLFLARFEFNKAKGLPEEIEREAQVKLDKILGKISEMRDREYAKIYPIILKITQHFPD